MDFSSSTTGGSRTTQPNIGSSIPHAHPVTAMDYHADGNHLFVATEMDAKVAIVDATRTGKPLDTTNGQAYRCDREGVSCLSATHHDYCILTAGNKQTSVQYWSLYDNKLLRKFRGHSSTIHEINMCPTEDMFLTSSKDRTVRLWNLQQAGCLAKLDLPSTTIGAGAVGGNPRAVFDSTGMVFTIMAEMAGGEGHYIHLYDARNYQGGAFSELKLTTASVKEAMLAHNVPNVANAMGGGAGGALTLNKIDFNANGNRILVQSEEGPALVLDGYEGTVQKVVVPTRGSNRGVVSCFTPDEKSVLVGSDAGTVDVYDVQNGSTNVAIATLAGGHGPGGAVRALACNPKHAQIASGGTSNTSLWIW